jgi:hypothetical protein
MGCTKPESAQISSIYREYLLQHSKDTNFLYQMSVLRTLRQQMIGITVRAFPSVALVSEICTHP